MSSLTQKEKLRALGVKAPSVQNNPYLGEFEEIESTKDYSTFVSDVNGLADFAAFETYLTDTIGLSASRAAQFRQKMEQKYASFSDFQNALSGFSGYDEWINSFSWGTTFGGDETDGTQITSGFRIHAEAGVSYDGVSVPKGTLEIFGPRIELSQAPAPIDATASFSTANFSVTDQTPDQYETITYSADVTNNSGYSLDHTAKLLEDGSVVASKTVEFAAGETKTIEFDRRYSELQSFDAQINDSSTLTVSVIPPGLVEPEDL